MIEVILIGCTRWVRTECNSASTIVKCARPDGTEVDENECWVTGSGRLGKLRLDSRFQVLLKRVGAR